MSVVRSLSKPSLISIALLIAMLAADAGAQPSKLGTVNFPTSGSEKAQAHFLRGLAALHSFWFEEALDEFREATKIDPDFAMGYWGEAMAHNHPLWAQQDTEAARQTLKKIKDTAKLTARERAYINAVSVLYGEGDKLARDKAYAAAMEQVYRAYPDDLEAACFYALSLLGTVRPGDKGFSRQAKAGAIALGVYEQNPNHPGAAHYVIHSFDDPEHAILALPAARRYAEIAPEAHHARHMPAHIFLQLGMWPEAAASNESAWAVSEAWVKRKNLPISLRDYHSLHWLLYVYLQQGRYGRAEELLAVKRRDMNEATNDTSVFRYNQEMAGAFIVETEAWNKAANLFSAPEQEAKSPDAGGHAGHTAGPASAGTPAASSQMGKGYGNQSLSFFIRGLAAAKSGSVEADKWVTELAAIARQLSDKGESYRAKEVEIRRLEVAAATAAFKENYVEAIELMKRATSLEGELSPPSGPPDLIKPSHELFGEILLAANRAKDAVEQFETSLARQPNRARSLLGLARALARSGESKHAAEIYSAFLRQWQQADAKLPETREAQDYLKQAGLR